MEYKEFTGKTVAEAIKTGLAELGLTEETADIQVLEEGKRKLFGSIKARVAIAPIEAEEEEETAEEAVETEEAEAALETTESGEETDGERAVAFLQGLFEILEIEAETTLVSEGDKIEINVAAANTTAIIGKRGAMLDAIQTLAGAVANTGRDDYKRVVVDCENYREAREATLQRLAEGLAAKAIRLEKKIKLEPMNPYERRIIHAALSSYEGVKTESEGKEPNRFVVIVPDNVSDPDAPAIPARSERSDRRGGNDRRYGRGGRDNRGGRGGRNDRGYKKPFRGNRPAGGSGESSGTTMKKSSDFFGTFLGNSKDL
ncbi:MAG: protein jag [Clostridia bacterium]|nr:protein jag [Clostridia bacterium]